MNEVYENKAVLRQQLANDVDEYLMRGGTITQCAIGERAENIDVLRLRLRNNIDPRNFNLAPLDDDNESA